MTPTDTPPRLLILRHAPLARPGLAGRRDVDADCSNRAALDWAAGALRGAATVWASPALRCRQTCAALALFPEYHPNLWEQDFGAWEEPGAAIPDLGPLPVAELAAHRPPGGESFLDMCARVQPQLAQAQGLGTVAVIAHAGTARAALAMAVGPAALSFSIAPLSLTILAHSPGGWAIEAVNRVAP